MENKTSKYFKYAIGEIVLVVIGILIALSINNWNHERINSAKSDELLQGICKDLDQDISMIDRAIGVYKSRLGFMKRHLTKTDFTTTPTDTLFLLMDGSTVPVSVTDLSYEKAKNLGITQLCTDDSLAQRINKYYTQTKDFIKVVGVFEYDELVKDNDYWMKDQEDLEMEFGTSFNIPLFQDSIERRRSAIEAISGILGRNHIKSECFMKERMLKFQSANRETVKELQADIEKYLEQ